MKYKLTVGQEVWGDEREPRYVIAIAKDFNDHETLGRYVALLAPMLCSKFEITITKCEEERKDQNIDEVVDHSTSP